jgi:hypothetical protein
MIRNWRSWVLLALFVGPILIYMGLGFLWLSERHWALYAFTAWVAAGIAFAYLANRWTKARRPVLPPIDWDAPRTFSPHDRAAWKLVEEEGERGDAIPIETLSTIDVYIETGRRLAKRLAAHYHPLSTDPIEHVPVVEILTALELAAEDLAELCHEVPGGDMVTYAHWKKAVQASGYINKANEIYTYLLPIFQPMTGLVRLGTQKLMVQPAWRNMQQNVMRWFYRSFVNRLGFHLIELYSHRLAIGADQYRRLTRRRSKGTQATVDERGPLVIAVAGAKDAGKSTLVAALDRACEGDLGPVRRQLAAAGFEEDLADRLKDATWVEAPSYTANPDGESARDRSTRRAAVDDAVEADLLLLVIDGTRDEHTADAKFVEAWGQWYANHPRLEAPPALAVVTGADRPAAGGNGHATGGLRTRLDAIRATLPASVADVVAVGLGTDPPTGLADRLLPALAPLLHRAERTASIRHLYRLSTRSKARRLASQVGRQGRRLWENLRASAQRTSKPA